MTLKRCIFHYPGPIEENPLVGSAVRPFQILNALKACGYIVEEVIGYGNERKKKIKNIKKSIMAGEKYDFLYSESLTMPTLLSEKDHLPKFPVLDFSFFKFCKKNGINIGLFYRDIHWKFPLYRESVKSWIPFVTLPFYKYDLMQYKRLVDILYVPSKPFMQYIEYGTNWKTLPSGGQYNIIDSCKRTIENSEKLNLFYVGGIVGLNDVSKLMTFVKDLDQLELTVCCPIEEWEKNKSKFNPCLGENTTIIHERGEGLKKYYEKADIACLYFPNNDYRDMAMPVKLFEYISYGKPIICNSKTAAAEYIDENQLGWIVDYDDDSLKKLLIRLSSEKNEIMEKMANVKKIAIKNTWKARAEEIINDLNDIEEVEYEK